MKIDVLLPDHNIAMIYIQKAMSEMLSYPRYLILTEDEFGKEERQRKGTQSVRLVTKTKDYLPNSDLDLIIDTCYYQKATNPDQTSPFNYLNIHQISFREAQLRRFIYQNVPLVIRPFEIGSAKEPF